MRPNPRTADYPDGSPIREQMEEFKHAYTAVLHLLHECFNGSPRLLAVATGLMYGLKDEAVKLMRLDSGDGETTVGPPFEWVPREQRHLSGSTEPKIVVVADGPYVVYGNVPLSRKKKITSAQGDSISWRKTETIETEETYALCRCGHVEHEAVLRRLARALRLRRRRARGHASDDRADPDRRGLARPKRTPRRCSRARASS